MEVLITDVDCPFLRLAEGGGHTASSNSLLEINNNQLNRILEEGNTEMGFNHMGQLQCVLLFTQKSNFNPLHTNAILTDRQQYSCVEQ